MTDAPPRGDLTPTEFVRYIRIRGRRRGGQVSEKRRLGNPTDQLTGKALGRLPRAPTAAKVGIQLADCDHLVLVHPPGPFINRPYPLSVSPSILGRTTDCDINLQSDDVSRQHAKLERIGEDWFLHDLNSTNGTYIEGERVERAILRHGLDVQVGNQTLRFLTAGSAELRRHHAAFCEGRLDPVTGLPLRELFEDLATAALLDDSRPIALLLAEIEYLDEVNRIVGRDDGDRLLKACMKGLLSLLGPAVHGGRLHGRRFGFIIDGADEAQTRLVAASMRATLERIQTEHPKVGVNLDLSIGGIVRPPGHKVSFRELTSIAEPLMQQMSGLGGGVLVELFSLASRDSNQFQAVSEGTVVGREPDPFHLYSRPKFERELPRFRLVVAFALDDRQRLEARDPGLVSRLDRLLVASVREVWNESLEARGGEDTGVIAPWVMAGKLTGGIYLLAATTSQTARVSSLALQVERIFERLRTETGLPSAHVTSGPPVERSGDCVDRAVGALLDRQRAAERDSRLPLPIAWAVLQVTAADEPVRRFFCLARLQQAITRWLFTLFAADCLANQRALPPAAKEDLAGKVSEGTWVKLARIAGEAAIAIPGASRRAPTLLDAVFPRGKKSVVLTELEAFTQDRNSVVHESERQCARLNEKWLPRLHDLLAGPLRVLEVVRPRHVSRLRHRSGSFEIAYRELVGDHAVVPSAHETVAEPMEDRKVFALDPVSPRALSLDPLVVFAHCPRCDLSELFFLEGYGEEIRHCSLREGRHELPSLAAAEKDLRDVAEAESALRQLLGE